MHERDTGKVASPAEGQRYGTHISEAGVAARLANVKAFVAVHPDTVIAVSAIRFSNNFIPVCLKYGVICF